MTNITDTTQLDPDLYAEYMVDAVEMPIENNQFQLMRTALERELSGRTLRVITIEVN